MKSLLYLLTVMLTLPVCAEVYQITDEHGRKTFTNIAPADGAQQKIEKVQLRETNTTPSHQAYEQGDAESEQLEQLENRTIRNRLAQDEQQARENLERAESELEDAKQIRSGDYFNVPGKGLRYRDEYRQRVEQAEQAVRQAKESYDQIRQRGPSQAPVESFEEFFPVEQGPQ